MIQKINFLQSINKNVTLRTTEKQQRKEHGNKLAFEYSQIQLDKTWILLD